jgi:hypothetical protein
MKWAPAACRACTRRSSASLGGSSRTWDQGQEAVLVVVCDSDRLQRLEGASQHQRCRQPRISAKAAVQGRSIRHSATLPIEHPLEKHIYAGRGHVHPMPLDTHKIEAAVSGKAGGAVARF